jgi:hypothetical protein
MNWKALKDSKCPQCGKLMVDAFIKTNPYYCECGFKISQEKFEKIVGDMYKPKTKSTEYQSEDDRLSELNNYGRNKVSEDFSDSPHLNY